LKLRSALKKFDDDDIFAEIGYVQKILMTSSHLETTELQKTFKCTTELSSSDGKKRRRQQVSSHSLLGAFIPLKLNRKVLSLFRIVSLLDY
jgi:hypothetical protein